jgi:penicillin-binding protein-related factor A (putative recombinase)
MRTAKFTGPKEKVIENQILAFLRSRQILAFKIKSVGTFDPTIRRFRTPSPWYRKGVSDILGIYREKFLAIEVKSEKGRLLPEQREFIDEVNENGGIAFVARSVEDVQARLEIA